MLSSLDLQQQILRYYGELLARRASWGGQLVFAAGDGCSSTGLAAAVSIAGGCALLVDPNAATVKAGFRQGGIDFVVNTLNEALRVLKNEIRQHKPLSVALIAPVEAVQAEMDERGVLPDLRCDFAVPTPAAEAWLAEHGWLQTVIPSTAQAALLAALSPDDTVRRRWLQRFGHYQRLGSERVVWLTAVEALACLSPPSLENSD